MTISTPFTRASIRSTTSARLRLLVAGGILAPITLFAAGPAAPAHADDGDGTGDGAAPAAAYADYATTAWSAPIRVEIYEPSLPIPVDAGLPQLEFDMGYTKVKADSGESRGRASLFWPGDPVGEGLKTFAEQLGMPPNPLTDGGYPVQVNSIFPGEVPTQKDESVPGAFMRTTSGENTASAETGFSPDGTVPDPDGADGGGAGGDKSEKNMLLDLLNGLSGALSGAGGLGGGLGGATTSTTRAAAPGIPPALSGVLDVDGYVSTSKMDATDGKVVGVSRATLGEVRLLGGLITLGGFETVARVTSDGTEGKATGKSVWGAMSIGGQEFGIGPDGAIVPGGGGQTTPIPGLNKLPTDALKALGVTFVVPEQVRTTDGDAATSVSQGLQVVIETNTLAPLLKALPTDVLAELIPAQAGPLKGVVAGLSSLAPKIVITLAMASAEVDTVEPMVFDDVAPADEAAAAPPAADQAPAADGGVGVPPAAGPAPLGAAPSAGDMPAGDLVGAAPASAGLPALFSIPGMLLLAAFALAAVAGSWFRRLGAAALGIGASCPHGLDSGLPDLRKA